MTPRTKIFAEWAERFADSARECIGGDADLKIDIPKVWESVKDQVGCCASIIDNVRKQKVDLWYFHYTGAPVKLIDGFFFQDLRGMVSIGSHQDKNKEVTDYWIDDYFYRLYRHLIPSGVLYIQVISLTESFSHTDKLAEILFD